MNDDLACLFDQNGLPLPADFGFVG